jgi:hypothetical protein
MEINACSSAVIAVHMQNDIVSENGGFGPLFAEMVTNNGTIASVKNLLGIIRRAGGLVVYTRAAFKSDYSDMESQFTAAGDDQAAGLPGGGYLADENCCGTCPAGWRLGHHPSADQWLRRYPAGRDAARAQRRHGADRGRRDELSVEGTARDSSNLGYRTLSYRTPARPPEKRHTRRRSRHSGCLDRCAASMR